MRLFQLFVLSAPLVVALTIPHPSKSNQETLVDENSRSGREKVPGDNPAYFSRLKRHDQLFWISEFTVSPFILVKYGTNNSPKLPS